MEQQLAEPEIVLTGRFEPEEVKRYRHVPFQVPAGVQQIHVRVAYSDQIASDPRLSDGNTLDIGLFDEGGTGAGGPGFRGWSGSNKLAFTVDAAWATPPYRPGPIGAGTWHVLLGPYKVGSRGLDYEVEIWFNAGVPPTSIPQRDAATASRPNLTPAAEAGWVRGDLHCHTLHSDGNAWPADVVLAAAEAGLDFLGITDHNSALSPITGLSGDAGLPVVVPGIEVTTYGGHWNVWGTNRWYDFREPRAAAVQAAVQEAIEAGGFVSVNHPKPFGPPWEYPEVAGYQAIEVWNGNWERLNSAALQYWDDRLRRGQRLVAIGGSDTHKIGDAGSGPLDPARLGEPTVWVRVDEALSPASVLAGLRAGCCFISAAPNGPQLYLNREDETLRIRVVGAKGNVLLLISDAGCVDAAPIAEADWERRFLIPSDAAYVRAEIVASGGKILALSNPVWIEEAD